MYIIMFAAAIKLRLKQPEVERVFRIPGGLPGLIGVAAIGLIGTLTTLVVSFMPPDEVNFGSLFTYETTLVIGLIIMCLPPFIFSSYQRRSVSKLSSKVEPA